VEQVEAVLVELQQMELPLQDFQEQRIQEVEVELLQEAQTQVQNKKVAATAAQALSSLLILPNILTSQSQAV
jgi:hypothetical protein